MRDSDIDALSADGAQEAQPRTTAGQRLDHLWPGSTLDRLEWREVILAIEAEAAHPADSAEALLREALERLERVLSHPASSAHWDTGPNGGEIAGAMVQARAAALQASAPSPAAEPPGYYATDEEINDWRRAHGQHVESDSDQGGNDLGQARSGDGAGVGRGGDNAGSEGAGTPSEDRDATPLGAAAEPCTATDPHAECRYGNGTNGHWWTCYRAAAEGSEPLDTSGTCGHDSRQADCPICAAYASQKTDG